MSNTLVQGLLRDSSGALVVSTTGSALVYRTLRDRAGQFNASTAGTRVLVPNGIPVTAAASSAVGAFYFDPADHAVAGTTTKLSLALVVVTNDVAPASDFTLSLRPFNSPAGAATVVGGSLAAAVTGSTVTILSATATANGAHRSATADFDVPVAGMYALAIVTSAPMAALSAAAVNATLKVRNVAA